MNAFLGLVCFGVAWTEMFMNVCGLPILFDNNDLSGDILLVDIVYVG